MLLLQGNVQRCSALIEFGAENQGSVAAEQLKTQIELFVKVRATLARRRIPVQAPLGSSHARPAMSHVLAYGSIPVQRLSQHFAGCDLAC